MNQIINGKREGYWYIHWDNNVSMNISYYKNDRLYGKFENYFDNGNLSYRCSFDGNDNLIGLEESFDITGNTLFTFIHL
jgi:antitoxin component YwqK of YwqJK toxin-antitoxin module